MRAQPRRAHDDDTIAAVATAPGAGGVGIVRISGARAAAIGAALCGRTLVPRRVQVATFRDGDGNAIDAGLALLFRAPRSFTGEDVLELQAHGSPVVLALLLARAIALGARAARPGEFSERAFLNGRIDLAQAEAIADLVASSSEAQARAAVRSLDGEFSRRVDALLARLVALRVEVEADIDFSDEALDVAGAERVAHALATLADDVQATLVAARRGQRVRDGLHAVIVGAPNAGKSTLLNALAGSERAIVTAIPGTTRDLLRETIALDGVVLTLVDTAGLRDTDDPIEAEGVRRARAELARADLALVLRDASGRMELPELPEGVARIVLHTKIDATHEAPRIAGDEMWLSARTGAGLDLLRAELRRRAGADDAAQGTFSARARHVDALARVAAHLEAAGAQWRENGSGELVADDLLRAQRALGEITGDYTPDDLLGAIFSTFCIGK
ncbi:MAG TPA: tRNA uridine-5-carboxymethylaminomethyl(34) synthesis GTPase MnmE [Xanthomonadales bacterium]|nr:tRNA uridine-5-carboxymethylaminomethyl(34) synthesis GTPase MnmE [Xanthomonadales bacterium]